MARVLYFCVPSNHNTPSIGSDGFEKVLIGTRGPREAFLDGGQRASGEEQRFGVRYRGNNRAAVVQNDRTEFGRVAPPGPRRRTATCSHLEATGSGGYPSRRGRESSEIRVIWNSL